MVNGDCSIVINFNLFCFDGMSVLFRNPTHLYIGRQFCRLISNVIDCHFCPEVAAGQLDKIRNQEQKEVR